MTNKSKTENILEMIKVICLVIGGCWIFFMYLSHDKQIKILESEKDKIDTTKGRQEIIINAQRIEQTILEDRIKNIELAYTKSIKETELKALELKNNSENIELKYQDLTSKLNIQTSQIDIQSKDIEKQLSEIKLRYSKARKIDSKFSMKVKDMGPDLFGNHLYQIRPRFEIQNTSSVELEISFVAIEIFENQLNYKYLVNDTAKVVTTGSIPNIFNKGGIGQSHLGDVSEEMAKYALNSEWKFISYDCGAFAQSVNFLEFNDSSNYNVRTYMQNHFYKTGRLATGILNPNENAFFEQVYYIRAKPTNVIGVTANIVLNKGILNDDLHSYSDSQILEDIK